MTIPRNLACKDGFVYISKHSHRTSTQLNSTQLDLFKVGFDKIYKTLAHLLLIQLRIQKNCKKIQNNLLSKPL